VDERLSMKFKKNTTVAAVVQRRCGSCICKFHISGPVPATSKRYQNVLICFQKISGIDQGFIQKSIQNFGAKYRNTVLQDPSFQRCPAGHPSNDARPISWRTSV
jgi:hypothetical protein